MITTPTHILSAHIGTRTLVFVAAVCIAWFAAASLSAQPTPSSDGVELVITAEGPDDDEVDGDIRERTRKKIAEKAVSRIRKRLDVIGVKNHEVEVDGDLNIRVRTGGSFDAATIESVVVPSGRLEIRPVLVDADSWLSPMPRLSDDIEFRPETESVRVDSFFLYAPSARSLRRVIDESGVEEGTVELYPHEDGWRTLRLGEAMVTEDDVEEIRLERSFAGAPRVTAVFDDGATRALRGAFDGDSGRVAVILDGEVVSLQRVSPSNTSELFGLDPPEHLRSMDAQRRWSTLVAGRLAAPIPVQLATFQE